MHNIIKRTAVTFIVLSLIVAPLNVMAAENLNNPKEIHAGAMAADALVVRPFGIVSVVGGFALFVVSSPFSALGGNIGRAWNAMVVKPAKFTFTRPLGDL
jgi:hypothetical protein